MTTVAFLVYETLTFLAAARLVALLTLKLGVENDGRVSEWVLATLFTTFVIRLVGEPVANCGSWETKVVVNGNDLQNEVMAVDETLTAPEVNQVDYLVRLQDPNCPDLQQSQAFARRAAQHAFTAVVVMDYVVVAGR